MRYDAHDYQKYATQFILTHPIAAVFLESFKSYQAKRFKSLLKARPTVRRIVGLTGTPSSNGLMDLWAEFRVLDLGQRLGRYITHY